MDVTSPSMEASMSAVMLSLSRAFTSAPRSTRSRIMPMCPRDAAAMSGVSLSQSRAFTSTPDARKALTAFSSPSVAAVMRRAPSELMASMSSRVANCSDSGVHDWSHGDILAASPSRVMQ